KRTGGILENGSWAPLAGKLMREYVEGFKDCVVVEPVVTIKSTLSDTSRAQLKELAQALTK
ncbi:MAG: FprA family A-type flavoprotein, partial [Acetatifactor sp.]|nr:FprA family A-type flavoprotein [Acetatifactor sp.]